MEYFVKHLVRAKLAKVKFAQKSWDHFLGHCDVDFITDTEKDEAFQKFWTVIDHCGSQIYIDLTEHLPFNNAYKTGFFTYRFDQVKCYISSEEQHDQSLS